MTGRPMTGFRQALPAQGDMTTKEGQDREHDLPDA